MKHGRCMTSLVQQFKKLVIKRRVAECRGKLNRELQLKIARGMVEVVQLADWHEMQAIRDWERARKVAVA